MTVREHINQLLPRKIVCSSLSGSLYAVLFGLFEPNPFETIRSIGEYLSAFILATPAYLMYSFPVILIYGTLTSTLSDVIACLIAKRTNEKLEVVVSGIFHVLFGLILLWVSMTAAVLFFVADRFLIKRADHYSWTQALKTLAIPLLVWIGFMSITAIIG